MIQVQSSQGLADLFEREDHQRSIGSSTPSSLLGESRSRSVSVQFTPVGDSSSLSRRVTVISSPKPLLGETGEDSDSEPSDEEVTFQRGDYRGSFHLKSDRPKKQVCSHAILVSIVE